MRPGNAKSVYFTAHLFNYQKMPEVTLTTAERIIIANQFQILAQQDESSAEDYNRNADILRNGYVGLYGHVFGDISEEQPEQVTEETHRILSMFRWIDNNLPALTDEERAQLDLSALKFKGFDGNHDDHYHQTRFMVERLGLYDELNARDLNSHSQSTLPHYERMLAVYDTFVNKPDAFKLENFKRLQEA